MVNEEEILVKFKGKKKKIKVRKLSYFGMIRGLCFRRKNFDNSLLFNFRKEIGYSIHSFFVFFDFLAVWLDDKNNACEIKIVKPFTLIVRPKRAFYRLIEIPVTKSNKNLIAFFVGKRKI